MGSLVVGHWSLVICRWSFVICHLSFVVGHLSFVICHLSFVIGIGRELYWGNPHGRQGGDRSKVEAPWTGSNTPSKISDPQQSVGGANGCLIVGDRLEPDSKPDFPNSCLNFGVPTSGVSKSLHVLLNLC